MSDKKGILTRWSRRKRGSAAAARAKPAPDPAGPDTQPLIDLASLPPIDSVGAGSDVTAFLAPGVPAGLARAALRRAWSADPAIRDFIGLSENSWDFNAPGGVPGFGALKAEDLQRLLAQVTGEPAAAPAAASDPGNTVPYAAREEIKPDPSGESEPMDPTLRDPVRGVAMQHESDRRADGPPVQRRRHGGALPE
jgi:hypothetical protein